MIKSNTVSRISPLARRLVIYIVLASTFITFFTSVFQLFEIYKSDLSKIESRLNDIQTTYSNNIASRVWVTNKKELISALNGILSLQDIEYIEVYENTTLIVQVGVKPKGEIITSSFPLSYTFRNKNIQIGRVNITASLEDTYNNLVTQAITIVAGNAVKTFLVSGFMLFLFYQLVIRHLITLGNFADKLNFDSLDNKLKLKRISRTGELDELDQLANTLSNLQFRLKKSITSFNESQDKISTLLDSTAEAIYGIDVDGKCTFANKACLNILGYAKDVELLDKDMHELIHYKYRNGTVYPVENCHIYQAIREEKEVHIDIEVLWRKDGSSFSAEYWSHPIYKEKKCNGAVVTFIDITERKSKENEKAALLKALKVKNTELEQFTYTVSHDLKSPLVTITGFVGLLKKDIENNNSKKIESDLITITNATKTMHILLDDLLAMSRIGSQTHTRKSISIESLVSSVLKTLETKIKDSQAIITIHPQLPTIYVDELRFKQVYLNLIENAINYRRNNVVLNINIGVRHDKDNDEEVLFVEDNGLGVNAPYHEKIFDLFERLSNDGSGTGIGLAIVKKIVEVHGGRIWVESAGLGKGSCFNFVISNNR